MSVGGFRHGQGQAAQAARTQVRSRAAAATSGKAARQPRRPPPASRHRATGPASGSTTCPTAPPAPRLINPDLGLHNLVARAGHNAAYAIDVTLLDAPDHRLIRSGVLLAHRVLDGRGEWYLTAPDWQPLLPKDRIELMGHADLPEEFADLLRPLRRRATLGPVAALNCDRREFALRDDHGTTLALLRDDKVTVRRGGLTTARYREVMITPIGPGLTDEQVAWLDRAFIQAGATVRAAVPAAGHPARRPGHRADRPAGARAVRRRRPVQEVRLPAAGAAAAADRRGRPGHPRRRPDALSDGWPTRPARLRDELKGLSPVLDPEWVEDLYDELGWISLDSAPSDASGRDRLAEPAAQRALPHRAGAAGRRRARAEARRGPGRAAGDVLDRAGRQRRGPAAAVRGRARPSTRPTRSGTRPGRRSAGCSGCSDVAGPGAARGSGTDWRAARRPRPAAGPGARRPDQSEATAMLMVADLHAGAGLPGRAGLRARDRQGPADPAATSSASGPRSPRSWTREESDRGVVRRLRGRRRGRQDHPGRPACRLADRRTGYEVVRTFEPGDTAVGAAIRRIVLDPATGDLSPRAEALLYAADKAQHLYAVVRPALGRGAVVVCDRYVDSMLAYQGAGRVLALAEVEQVARWATGGPAAAPDGGAGHRARPRPWHAKADKDRLEAAGDGVPRAGPAVLPGARGPGAGALPGAGRARPPGTRSPTGSWKRLGRLLPTLVESERRSGE